MKSPWAGKGLSLTAQVALVGTLAAFLPFLLAIAIIAFAPANAIDGTINRSLDQRLAIAVVRLAEDRSLIRARIAELDRSELARAARTKNYSRLESIISSDGRPVIVRELTKGATASNDVRVVEYISTGQGLIMVLYQADDARLAELGRELDVDLAMIRDSKVSSISGMSRSDLDRSGHSYREGLITRSQFLDQRGTTILVAGQQGNRFALLSWSQGPRLWAVLGALLAIGLFTSLAAALLFNRRLRTYADQATAIADGDYAGRLPVVGNDAAAHVALSLNELAADLSESISDLRTSFDRLDRTLAATDDGVCLWSIDGKIELWNEAAIRLTGVHASAGMESTEVAQLLSEQRLTGQRRVLLPLPQQDRQLLVHLTVTQTRDGGTLQVFRDAAPSIAIDQVRSNFLVTAAHELRTPLTPLVGFLPMVLDEWSGGKVSVTDDDRRRVRGTIEAALHRLDELVSKLFDASILGVQQTPVSLQRIVLSNIVEAATKRVCPKAEITWDFNPDLSIRCDPSLLVDALTEVLDNAIKYGDEPVVVAAEFSGDNELLHIRIANGGPVISQDVRLHGFEPFFRGDPNMQSSLGGIGLGLYRARRAVEAMGGSIAFDEPLDGCAVSIRLPVSSLATDAVVTAFQSTSPTESWR